MCFHVSRKLVDDRLEVQIAELGGWIIAQVGGFALVEWPGDGLAIVAELLEVRDPFGPALVVLEHPVDEEDTVSHGVCFCKRIAVKKVCQEGN